MQKIPEQSHISEQDLDFTEQKTLELQNPENESLEQKGQRLAAQIKDMYATAKTKEDYEAVQQKIAELRSFFESTPETEANKLVYRSLMSVIDEVVMHFGTTTLDINEWNWSIHELPENEKHPFRLRVNMPNIKKSVIKEIKFDTPSDRDMLNSAGSYLTQNTGMSSLARVINNRKVRSYCNDVNGTWMLEVEPEPYRSYEEVFRDTMFKINNFDPNIPWGVVKLKNSKKEFIDMNIKFNVLKDNIDGMNFNSFPPKQLLVAHADHYDNALEDLTSYIAHRGVKSYNVDGKWFLELEPQAEPVARRIDEVLAKVLNYLVKEGQSNGDIVWSRHDDGKYIDMGITLNNSMADNPLYFHKATQEDVQNVLDDSVGRSKLEGSGYKSLLRLCPAGTKVISLSLKNRWYLKIVD